MCKFNSKIVLRRPRFVALYLPTSSAQILIIKVDEFNYEEMMNYAYTLKSKVLSSPQKEKSKTKKNKDIKNISKQNLYNKVNDNFEVNLIPKKEILVDRLLRKKIKIKKRK